jgi:hypothetical protein
MFEKSIVPEDRYRDLLSVPGIKRKASCIVRKGEKQIQILDDY